MNSDQRPTFLARLARRPAPIFLGLAVGFLACCAAGRVAARQQPYKNFVRFHPGLGLESHYYPTFSQTLNLAREKAVPGKTLVLVGGNSVLHGVGQRVAHVWSAELQKLLGEDYVVLNLAMRGQAPNEFGGVVAERLAVDGVPVVYVTLGFPQLGWGSDWDGSATYRYFFWDAWGKGLIPSDSRRDPWLDEGFFSTFAKDQQALEARRRGRIDGLTYAQDLWTYVAARFRGSVWTPLKYPRFWRPHCDEPDTDPGSTQPWELANNETVAPIEMSVVRSVIQTPTSQGLLKGEQYAAVAKAYAALAPDALRHRTLYVLRLEGTYYRKRLSTDEQTAYLEIHKRYADAVRQGGMHALVFGENYADKDYFDRSHLSESGGRKLAEELAPVVRAIASERSGAKAPDVGEEKP